MIRTRRGPGDLAAALAQTAAGAAVHVAASGCLPVSGVLVLPAAVVGVLLVAGLLPERPVLRLATGQLLVHALLTVSACASAAHVHAASPGPHAPMALAHVAALVVCRGALGAVAAGAERAAAHVLARVRPVGPVPVLPQPPSPTPVVVRRTAAPVQVNRHRRTPRRGPPARGLVPLPV